MLKLLNLIVTFSLLVPARLHKLFGSGSALDDAEVSRRNSQSLLAFTSFSSSLQNMLGGFQTFLEIFCRLGWELLDLYDC